MKNLINIFTYTFSKILSKIALILNIPLLTAISWFFVLRLYKNFEYSNVQKTKVIILEKSFGIEDIISSFHGVKSKIKFYYFPRSHISLVYYHFLKKYSLEENNYNFYSGPKLVKDKKRCEIYFQRTIFYLRKFFDFKGFINFNFKYHREIELQKATLFHSLKFLSCHKESLLTESDIKSYKKILGKGIGKYNGSFITAYNKIIYKLIIDKSIVEPNKVKLIGMPRADKLFKIRKKKLEENYILFFLVDIGKGFTLKKDSDLLSIKKIENVQKKNWSKYSIKLLNAVIKISKKFPEQKFIFKAKVDSFYGTLNQTNILKNKMPHNCKLITRGSGIDLIKKSSAVIGFNSTGILESAILNKLTIVPFMNVNYKKDKDNMLRVSKKIYHYPKNEKELEKLIAKVISKKIINKKYYPEKDDIIDYYLGNIDGNSSQRMRNIIYKLFL